MLKLSNFASLKRKARMAMLAEASTRKSLTRCSARSSSFTRWEAVARSSLTAISCSDLLSLRCLAICLDMMRLSPPNGWELRLRLENSYGGQVQPEADPPLAEGCLRLRRVVQRSYDSSNRGLTRRAAPLPAICLPAMFCGGGGG